VCGELLISPESAIRHTHLKEAVPLLLDANRTLAEESLKGETVIREPLLLQER